MTFNWEYMYINLVSYACLTASEISLNALALKEKIQKYELPINSIYVLLLRLEILLTLGTNRF